MANELKKNRIPFAMRLKTSVTFGKSANGI